MVIILAEKKTAKIYVKKIGMSGAGGPTVLFVAEMPHNSATELVKG